MKIKLIGKTIKRYLRLLASFFRYSLMGEMEFRSSLLFWTVSNMLWLALGVIGVELIFGQISDIAGWTKNEVFIVLFFSALFNDVAWTLIYDNLDSFSRYIRYGKLDYQLLLPVNTRFLLSFRKLEFDHYVRIVLELGLIWQLTRLEVGHFSALNALAALFLFVCGFIIFYSLFFALTVCNIWFTNLANVLDFFGSLAELGKRPIDIFKRGWYVLFAYFLPVGFIATFPAEAILGKIDGRKLILAPVLALFSLFLSQKFFNFALKYYSSASR